MRISVFRFCARRKRDAKLANGGSDEQAAKSQVFECPGAVLGDIL